MLAVVSFGAERPPLVGLLLPLLTTHADSLLVTAKGVIRGRLEAYDVALGPDRLDAAIAG